MNAVIKQRVPAASVLVLTESTERLAGAGLAMLVPVAVQGRAVAGETWHFETSNGEMIDLPLTAARAWERPPYSMLVRLTAAGAALGEEAVLAEAVIGTRVALEVLLDKIVATMRILLRAALRGGMRLSVDPLASRLARSRQILPLALAEGRLRHALHRWQDRLLAEHWAIGVAAQSPLSLIEGEPLAAVSWVDPGRFGDLADPHPWPGRDQILCEEMPDHPPGAPGRILAIDLEAAGPAQSLLAASGTLVLGGGMHRSYPGATLYNGEILLLPETPVRGETVIYCLGGDGALSPVCRVAPDVRVADPTLFWHGDRFWIAYTDLDVGAHDNLCLMHAPSVQGPWTQHRHNPVKLDIRSSRPAGPMLRHQGALFRPAQDCARTYGAAVVLNRVDILTVDAFREVTVRRIEPPRDSPFPDGLHTLAAAGDNRLLLDGKRLALRPRVLAARAWSRAASLSPRSAADTGPLRPGGLAR